MRGSRNANLDRLYAPAELMARDAWSARRAVGWRGGRDVVRTCSDSPAHGVLRPMVRLHLSARAGPSTG